MKTMILAIAAVFVMSTNAFAQGNGQRENRRFSQEEMVQRQTDRQATQLGLDDTQKAALLKLNTEYAGKLRGGMNFGGPRGGRFERNDSAKMERPTEAQMKEMREKMQAERAQMEESQKAYNAELKNILTEEQYAKYEEQQKQMRQRGGRGQGFGRGQGGGQRGQGFGRAQRERNNDAQTVE